MGEGDHPVSGDLDDLDRKLKKHRKARERRRREETRRAASPYGFGFRLVSDLVVAIIAGFLAGWALDAWLGTSPWMVLLLTPLGMAAGIVNVVRAASSREAERHLAAIAAAEPERQEDETRQQADDVED